MIDYDLIFKDIPSWTEKNEREVLAKYAEQVPEGGVILEIGALYGGVTAILALSAPNALVVSIDNFSWTPEGYPKASLSLMSENLKRLGINNFQIIEATSIEAYATWNTHIDFLWIDGGHDFNSVYYDLSHYSTYTNLIALHDYDNPAWPSIREAVEKFLSLNNDFKIIEVVGMVVVLKRNV